MHVLVCMWPKIACLMRSHNLKSPVSVIYCLLVEISTKKCAYYARQFVLGKEVQKHFINWTGEKPMVPKYCIMISHTLSKSAMNANKICRMPTVEHQRVTPTCNGIECRPTLSLYRYSVLRVLSVHRVCVLCGTLVCSCCKD